MITPEIRATIRRLVLREGWKIETTARRFGVHHSVVRRALRDLDQPAERRPVAPSELDPFKEYLVQRLTEHPELTAVRLFLELQLRGFKGGIAQLRRYVAQIRAPRVRKAYLRIETEPGEQAQVDWGSFGHWRIGNTQRPLSAFAMVMRWSRALYVDFALDQRMDTFLRMHQRALAFFGGVPKRIVYDNLKSVVLHHVGSTVQFNPAFLAFAGHYLFEPVAAPVRYPEFKGGVEAAIKFIRHSFFYGRTFSSLEDLRSQAFVWATETANTRIHGTTRERPAERLLLERPRLRSLPEHAFDTDLVLPMIVSKEARVHLDTNTYSVPHGFVGRSVHLRADDTTVRILADGAVIAKHPRSWGRRQAIEDRAHIDALLERRPAGRAPRRRDRLAALSPECRVYLQEVARRRIDLECELQKLGRLLQLYGPSDLAEGMKRALAARTFGARYVRALIDQSRFARGLGEPPEPIVTGNTTADEIVVEPHSLETYDALFQTSEAPSPTKISTPDPGDR
ncbi:MAG TPA: IS21 family transposase [Solirubrobacterales bacterium]|nr:IS21 family transposase [Solirubrobacterales bacterium]